MKHNIISSKSISINNAKMANTNFKAIKKLDLKSIDKSKEETENPKEKTNVQNKSDIERETIAENLISKDLEKYIEFLSTDDEFCDQLLNYQMPYLFLGINDKKSLSTTGKELAESHVKSNDEFFKRIEKKIESSSDTPTHTNLSNKLTSGYSNSNSSTNIIKKAMSKKSKSSFNTTK